MFQRLIAVTFTSIAGCLLALSLPGVSSGSTTYVPRPHGPIEIAGRPVALGTPGSGGRFDDLEVLTNSPGGLQRFENFNRGGLRLEETFPLPGTLTSFSDQDRFTGTTYRATVRTDIGSVLLLNTAGDYDPTKLNSIPAGGHPSSVTMLSMLSKTMFFPGSHEPSRFLAVTDKGADTFSIIDPDATDPNQAQWSIGVGSEPVAASTDNDFFWLVANKASDDVSVVSFVAGDHDPQGHLELIRNIPVGDSPIAITSVGGFDPSFAVVNQGSDSVSILQRATTGATPDASLVQTIPVGKRPTSITPVDANGDKFTDLAVANSGSDDVSILINEGDEGFDHGARVGVGDRPIAITSMRLDRFFVGDLAVANAGDQDISLLLRRDGPARCYGRPAHPVEGTPGAEVLWGTRDPDRIHGFGGNDTIGGSTGYDCLTGGDGKDLIRAGFHNDRVFGGRGNDRLTAHVGNDVIRAGRGDDVICDSDQVFSRCFGQRNKDYRPNVSDRDRAFGGRGDDRITAGPQRDLISGGRGDDVIDSKDGDRDRVRCGPGSDVARTDIKDRTSDCEVIQQREPHRGSQPGN